MALSRLDSPKTQIGCKIRGRNAADTWQMNDGETRSVEGGKCRAASFDMDDEEKVAAAAKKSSWYVEHIEELNTVDRFDPIIYRKRASKAKSDREAISAGGTRAGGKPADCVLFEDAEAGLQADRPARMCAVGIEKTIKVEPDATTRTSRGPELGGGEDDLLPTLPEGIG